MCQVSLRRQGWTETHFCPQQPTNYIIDKAKLWVTERHWIENQSINKNKMTDNINTKLKGPHVCHLRNESICQLSLPPHNTLIPFHIPLVPHIITTYTLLVLEGSILIISARPNSFKKKHMCIYCFALAPSLMLTCHASCMGREGLWSHLSISRLAWLAGMDGHKRSCT